jgi:hypothetical protein
MYLVFLGNAQPKILQKRVLKPIKINDLKDL